MNFNRYKLNANYTTEDGINLIDPEFRITQIFYSDESGQNEVLIKWKDANHPDGIDRPCDAIITDPNFPTVAFLENQLLQIPIFANSTLIPDE